VEKNPVIVTSQGVIKAKTTRKHIQFQFPGGFLFIIPADHEPAEHPALSNEFIRYAQKTNNFNRLSISLLNVVFPRFQYCFPFVPANTLF
jgi:hypothetical protein